jgi:hypothetical protein
MADETHSQDRQFTSRAQGEGVRILPDDPHPLDEDDARQVPGASRYGPAMEPYMPEPVRRHTPAPAAGTTHRESSPEAAPVRVEAPQARRGPSTCSIVAGTFALLALSCLLLAFAALQGGLDGLGKLIGIVPSIGLPLRTPTVIIDTSKPTIVQSVRALSKLETVHYRLEKVITGKSQGPLPDFLTSDRILLVAHGEVVAGIDLGSISANDVTVSEDSVTIKLPEPEILYSRLDNDKTYVYDRQTGVFSKPDPNLESQMRATAEEQIRLAAEEDGILARARENGEQTLRTLIKGLGYGEVEFEEGP